jgi:hypothetical protein
VYIKKKEKSCRPKNNLFFDGQKQRQAMWFFIDKHVARNRKQPQQTQPKEIGIQHNTDLVLCVKIVWRL